MKRGRSGFWGLWSVKPQSGFGALGAGQGTASPERCQPRFWWLLVAFALAALPSSPGKLPEVWGQHRDIPASHHQQRWEPELIPAQGSAPGETPGAPPRLCATSEPSRRRNPTRRRILHQPKASGGANLFAAASPPPVPPKIDRFSPEFPVFPKQSPGSPDLRNWGVPGGCRSLWDAPARDTPANSLPLQECEQKQSGNQTVWGQ